MRLNRFIGNFKVSGNNINIDEKEVIRQIRDILKMKKGELLILSDGAGIEIKGEIIEIAKSSVNIKILNQTKLKDTGAKVNLYLAILKKENFELAVQKAVECGVSKIIPIITERTIKTGLNTDRIEKIIKEASEQSGRNFIPKLLPIAKYIDALREVTSEEKIIFHPSNESYSPMKNIKDSSIFIGPEGGFTENEINLAIEKGFRVNSLGELILRGETAAIVATYRAVQRI